MRAIKKVKKFIERSPNSTEGITFAKLILALESENEFPVIVTCPLPTVPT